MRILFSPQETYSDDYISYSFEGEKIIVKYAGITDEFDFTDMPDGEVAKAEDNAPTDITTDLPFNPILSAVKRNGELEVVLLNYIKSNATKQEKFPTWQEV